jgi:hypothetical protein
VYRGRGLDISVYLCGLHGDVNSEGKKRPLFCEEDCIVAYIIQIGKLRQIYPYKQPKTKDNVCEISLVKALS